MANFADIVELIDLRYPDAIGHQQYEYARKVCNSESAMEDEKRKRIIILGKAVGRAGMIESLTPGEALIEVSENGEIVCSQSGEPLIETQDFYIHPTTGKVFKIK